MKTQKTNKMGLKKLTIAKISVDGMISIKGGTSGPVHTGLAMCTFHNHGGPGRR